MADPVGRSVWTQRALVWTFIGGALLSQAFLLVRFAGDGMAAYIADPDAYGGRWWHKNEPLFAYAGYALLVVFGFFLARAWTRVAKPPRVVDAVPEDVEADEDGVTIDVPAFLKPKTRRTRKGVGALVGLTILGGFLAVGGVLLGVFESLQMFEVLRRNGGNPAALALNSTVWIRRLMEVVAPVLAVLGAAVVGLAWGVYWPLPPAEEVVVEDAPSGVAAPGRAEWNSFD